MTSRKPVIEAIGVSRTFGSQQALDNVSLSIPSHEIHALLGPNAAGKSTLLRILSGLTDPSSGDVRVLRGAPHSKAVRTRIGWVPSGDRSFYLRISGLENLVFFGRLYGLPGRQARRRALQMLEAVGLSEAADRRAGLYSHGMLKRLSVARGLLSEPRVLLCDEATHDLDPRGAAEIRALVEGRARSGTTVVWATQRLEEIAGFADSVTVLDRGSARFQGSLRELLTRASSRRFRMRLRNPSGEIELDTVREALAGDAQVEPAVDKNQFLVDLRRELTLGQGIARLARAGIDVISCSEDQSEVESAFLALTESFMDSQ